MSAGFLALHRSSACSCWKKVLSSSREKTTIPFHAALPCSLLRQNNTTMMAQRSGGQRRASAASNSTSAQSTSSGSGRGPGGGGGRSGAKGRRQYLSRTSKAVWVGRILFLLCLVVAATVLGYTAFFFLTRSEVGLAETQFGSIVDNALEASRAVTERKRLGTVLMASIFGNAAPDAASWPFVTMDGYEEIATHAIETSSGREMGFCPLVRPDQLDAFEEFAYDFFENGRDPPFPNGTAVSSFGKGVWGMNPDLNTTDNRYHETNGNTSYWSPNRIFAPILQHNAGPHKALMLNLHFQEERGLVIDYLIECAAQRASALARDPNATVECISITDMLILTSQEIEPGPGALIMQPIYPAKNNALLTGIIASSIVWDEILKDVFAGEVTGIDCVLVSDTQVYTYNIVGGIPMFK